MTGHPNAQILAQLAEIAKTNPEPWKRLEAQDIYGNWVTCGCQIALLNPDVVLRIKPTTVNIGGVELEGPLREAPENNETCQRRNQMTTPRPHYDSAVRYFMDNTTTCWARNNGSNSVVWTLMLNPTFNAPDLEYYVGHEPPPIKRTVTLTVNGREWVLPEPLRETPKHDQLVFYISDDGTVRSCQWNNWTVLPTLYKEQRLHDTKAYALAWADFDKWCRGGGV